MTNRIPEDVMTKIAHAQKKLPTISSTRKPETFKHTLYLHPGIHYVIKSSAQALRITQQEIFRQALNIWLARKGFPSMTEIAEAYEQDLENEK